MNKQNIVLVFDLDDTLFPTSENASWISKSSKISNDPETMAKEYKVHYQTHDEELVQIMQKLTQYPKFILTNATYGHTYACMHALGISKYIHAVIDRNVGQKFFGVPYPKFFKPNPMCYQVTQGYIKDYLNYYKVELNNDIKIFFFDDKIENLLIPNKLGWITIYIGKDPNIINNPLHFPFISLMFRDIYKALQYVLHLGK